MKEIDSSVNKLCGEIRAASIAALIGAILAYSACGYRIRSSKGVMPPDIQSIGIPTFINQTGQYKMEQLISNAVLREFSLRTRIPIASGNSGVDSVLLGEIRNVSATPIAFDLETFGSAFMITVQISAKLIRVRDSAVVWQNDDFLYRERYMLNSKVTDFFSEENPALSRLSRNFAASLVSAILQRTTP